MKLIKGASYTADNSDLSILIMRIGYRCPEYTKAKIHITNKHNGIFYQTTGYMKLCYDKISHWKRSC